MTFLRYLIAAAFAALAVGIVLAAVQNKRLAWLLPAATYAISSGLSFAIESWWPLFIGYALAKLLFTLRVGFGTEPPQRPHPVGFYVNHGLHILAGVVGSEIFTWTEDGLLRAALLCGIIHGLDTVGIYYTYTRLLANAEQAVRKALPIKMLWLFPVKVVWYGLITLGTASAVRSFV